MQRCAILRDHEDQKEPWRRLEKERDERLHGGELVGLRAIQDVDRARKQRHRDQAQDERAAAGHALMRADVGFVVLVHDHVQHDAQTNGDNDVQRVIRGVRQKLATGESAEDRRRAEDANPCEGSLRADGCAQARCDEESFGDLVEHQRRSKGAAPDRHGGIRERHGERGTVEERVQRESGQDESEAEAGGAMVSARLDQQKADVATTEGHEGDHPLRRQDGAGPAPGDAGTMPSVAPSSAATAIDCPRAHAKESAASRPASESARASANTCTPGRANRVPPAVGLADAGGTVGQPLSAPSLHASACGAGYWRAMKQSPCEFRCPCVDCV